MNTAKTLIALLSLAAVNAFAQAPAASAATPGIDKREAAQQARIAQGAQTGTLTPRETQRLEKEQGRINTTEANAKADGVVTGKERRKLHAMQDGASRDIHHKKHNARGASAPAGN
jgi:hypothetical protein